MIKGQRVKGGYDQQSVSKNYSNDTLKPNFVIFIFLAANILSHLFKTNHTLFKHEGTHSNKSNHHVTQHTTIVTCSHLPSNSTKMKFNKYQPTKSKILR